MSGATATTGGGGSGGTTGGAEATGGEIATGGTTATGGGEATGGQIATGGTTATGGAQSTGGQIATGGTTATGGVAATGGQIATGGTTATGGVEATGGETATGGTTATGGAGTGGDGAAGAAGTGGSAPTTGCGSPAGLTSGRASIDVSGKTREYILTLPDNYDPNQAYRLIFYWHPWGGSAQGIVQLGYSGLQSASNGQAILVAPEGQDYQDGGLGWGNENGEDIDFYHAMVDLFSSELCIDQDRIFSTGFSFGAMFTFTLACTENSMLRAIAPQAGNTFTSGGCEDSTRSVAAMPFIGTDDSLLEGHRQAVQVFVERNGCSTQTTTVEPSYCDGLSSSYLPCTCVEYQGCSAGYPVIECEYKGGHMFAPDVGDTMWAFFSQF